MDAIGSVLAKLGEIKGVEALHVPDEESFRSVVDIEAEVQTGSGMAVRNEALVATMERTHHIFVLQGSVVIGRVPHHSMTWEDSHGKVIAFDVPRDMRHEVEGRDDLIWISADFAMLPVVDEDTGDITVVFHPSPVGCLGEAEGVKDAIMMHPAPPADAKIREICGFDRSGKYATGILSFNLA